MRADPAGLKLPGFDFEQKAAGRRHVGFERVGREPIAEDLPADSGVTAIVQIVGDVESRVRVRQRVDRRVAGGHGNGPLDHEFTARVLLFDEFRFLEHPEVVGTAAIHGRQLRALDLDKEIVDPQSTDGGHTMLDRLNADVTLLDARATAAFRDVGDHGGDTHRPAHVGPYEDDSRILWSRTKGYTCFLAPEEAFAGKFALTLYRRLQLQAFLPSP